MNKKTSEQVNRYSVHRNGLPAMDVIQEILSVGGEKIVSANKLKIVFANLTKTQADTLKSRGCCIKCVDKVKLSIMPVCEINTVTRINNNENFTCVLLCKHF